MQQTASLEFDQYRIDPENRQVWRGDEVVELRPMSVAVLYDLVEHAGEVVAKEDLLERVWSGTHVTKTVLKVCVREIREALDDDASTPRYIETVGREGYRFIADLGETTAPADAPELEEPELTSAPRFVGREAELNALQESFVRALRSERQLVFVTGEAGIGKTTVVDLFAGSIQQTGRTHVGWGQCLEQYGAGEAYMPVLEAIGRLCRGHGGEQVVAALRQVAPTWLVQLPSVVSQDEREALAQRVEGATRERMLREMAEVLEVLTAEHGLVLVLEDVHWSDTATLDLLSYVSQRREPAKLLIIGTYRPTDIIIQNHPLRGFKQELQAKGLCSEIALELLSRQEITDYLAGRLSGPISPKLTEFVQQCTEGNALFVVNVLEHLMAQGLLVQADEWQLREGTEASLQEIPSGLLPLIEKHIGRLDQEQQRVLEVASVAGAEFAAAAVAAGVDEDIEHVEDICEELASRRHFVEETGLAEWPDGTLSGQYRFRHALYKQVLYTRIAEIRRVRLHRAIGEREETGYGTRAGEHAAALATHFEHGRDIHRAIRYRQLAGENAVRRSANQEAITHFTHGLELLATLPDSLERAEQELALLAALASPLMSAKGYAAPEVQETQARARALCQRAEATPKIFPVLRTLISFHQVRAEPKIAHELGEQLLTLVERVDDTLARVQAHYGHGATLFNLGELPASNDHMKQSLALYDPEQHKDHIVMYGGYDPGVACRNWVAMNLWMLGYPDQAQLWRTESLQLAQELNHPYSLAWALYIDSVISQFLHDWPAAQSKAEAALAICREHGFPYILAMCTIHRGWALIEQGAPEEGVAELRHGLNLHQATGAAVVRPLYKGMLAATHAKGGQLAEAFELAEDAITEMEQTGQYLHAPDLYRLKGMLLLFQPDKGGDTTEAESYLQRALEVTHQQETKSVELQVAMALGRVWHNQGKAEEAHQLLAPIYNWFTEGFETKDLQDAKAFLTELE